MLFRSQSQADSKLYKLRLADLDVYLEGSSGVQFRGTIDLNNSAAAQDPDPITLPAANGDLYIVESDAATINADWIMESGVTSASENDRIIWEATGGYWVLVAGGTSTGGTVTDITATLPLECDGDPVSPVITINEARTQTAADGSADGKGTAGGYCGPAVKPIALNMVAQIARTPETHGLPISGIGGVTTWRDAAEFLALGAGNVQVCTAAMTYGFGIIKEMTAGLSSWMDEKGYNSVDEIVGRAVPNVTDWQYLNLNYTTKARIDQDSCISCGRCYAACEDTSHQAIAMSADRVFTVKDDECVACNMCVNVCPVENCITMEQLSPGDLDERTGNRVAAEYGNWTQHPNNPMAKAAE